VSGIGYSCEGRRAGSERWLRIILAAAEGARENRSKSMNTRWSWTPTWPPGKLSEAHSHPQVVSLPCSSLKHRLNQRGP